MRLVVDERSIESRLFIIDERSTKRQAKKEKEMEGEEKSEGEEQANVHQKQVKQNEEN